MGGLGAFSCLGFIHGAPDPQTPFDAGPRRFRGKGLRRFAKAVRVDRVRACRGPFFGLSGLFGISELLEFVGFIVCRFLMGLRGPDD